MNVTSDHVIDIKLTNQLFENKCESERESKYLHGKARVHEEGRGVLLPPCRGGHHGGLYRYRNQPALLGF